MKHELTSHAVKKVKFTRFNKCFFSVIKPVSNRQKCPENRVLTIALFSCFKLIITIFERNVFLRSLYKRIKTQNFGHF